MEKLNVQVVGSGYVRALKTYKNYKEKFRYYNANSNSNNYGQFIRGRKKWLKC